MNDTTSTAAPALPAKKKGAGGKVLTGLGVLLLIGAIANSCGDSSTSGSAAPAATRSAAAATVDDYDVTYRITGTARTVDITMSDSDGDTVQQSDLPVPVVKVERHMHSGEFAYISAQNQGESGTVTCTIELDGVPVKTSTSSGAYVIATCSGRI